MDWSNFALVALMSALGLIFLQFLTWVWSQRAGKLSVADSVWGAGFVVVGLMSLLFGSGDGQRRLLLFVLVALWGLRLSWHIYVRSRDKGEDPRYAELYGDMDPKAAALRVFGFQGLLQFGVSLPLQGSAAAGATTGFGWVLLVLGIIAYAIGLTFEVVGDAQLKAYMKKKDANKSKVMDEGLWAWTRHPNYFGDACLWWGFFLIALSGSWALWWTLVGPAIMTFLLRNGSGAKTLEKSMKERPGYREYMKRTAYFFPRPPKK